MIIFSHCGIIVSMIFLDVSSAHSAISYNKDVENLNVSHNHK